MVQNINFPGFGATSGIIGLLFIIGMLTWKYVDIYWGLLAIKLSIFFGGMYAFCGLLGIIKKLVK